MFQKFFDCFLLVKNIIDVVVIVLRRHEIQKVSDSLQTPMYDTDENKNNVNLRMENVTGNETIAAPMSEGNPTSVYPHVHFVNNSMSFSSNMTESQGIDPNVFYSSGKAPSTSSNFLNYSYNGNAANTSKPRIAPNSNGNASLPPP